MEEVINYEHVNIYQGKDIVLSDVSLTVNAGEFIYLIGKTGAGKSSFLKTLYGDLEVNEGAAVVCGYDMTKLKKSRPSIAV